MKNQKKVRETHTAEVDGLLLTVTIDFNTGVTTAHGNMDVFLTQDAAGNWTERENFGAIGDNATKSTDQVPTLKTKIKKDLTLLDETVRGATKEINIEVSNL